MSLRLLTLKAYCIRGAEVRSQVFSASWRYQLSRSKSKFTERLLSQWLQSFCNARDKSLSPDGFVADNVKKLSEFDAKWFLQALDAGYVTEEGGFFLSELSAAKEQILWEGVKADHPRKLYLWLEPIITIGAFARLLDEYQWPQSQIGLQSKAPWPFDLMGYGADRETELLACEVKKSEREIYRLVGEMTRFSAQPQLAEEPKNPTIKNAYRKVVGIRRSWPAVFWALGPDGVEKVFEVAREPGTEKFSLNPVSSDDLRYRHGT